MYSDPNLDIPIQAKLKFWPPRLVDNSNETFLNGLFRFGTLY